jgi:hypothetical protein
MANLSGFIDYNASPESQYSPLPSGEYVAIITDSDVKTTKKGDGQYLELTYQIADGPYSGRQVWVRITLANPNATAVTIGQTHLAQLRHATGRLTVSDSAEFHNIPHVVRIEHVPANPAKGRDRDGNDIKEFKALAGAKAPAAQPQVSASKPAGGLPWQRNAA